MPFEVFDELLEGLVGHGVFTDIFTGPSAQHTNPDALWFLMGADEFRVARLSPGDWTGSQIIQATQPNLGVRETWTLTFPKSWWLCEQQ